MEVLVLHLLDRCRDDFHRVWGLADPATNESSALTVALSIERYKVVMRCVEAVSNSLCDGSIAAFREGPPVGLFDTTHLTSLGVALPTDRHIDLSFIGIIRYLGWVHSSFTAVLAPIINPSSSLALRSSIRSSIGIATPPPRSLTTLAIFAKKQLNLLVAAWQRIISAAALSLCDQVTPPSAEKQLDDNATYPPSMVHHHVYRSAQHVPPLEDISTSPQQCSEHMLLESSISPEAEAALDVCRRSVQVRRPVTSINTDARSTLHAPPYAM